MGRLGGVGRGGLPGVWFDRLTRDAGCAWLIGCCWVPHSTSSGQALRGRRDGGGGGRVGWVGCWEGWFDTVFRGLQTGSPRTGWVGDAGCAEEAGRKPAPTQEQDGDGGGGGGRGLGGSSGGCGSTRPLRQAQGRIFEGLQAGSPRTDLTKGSPRTPG